LLVAHCAYFKRLAATSRRTAFRGEVSALGGIERFSAENFTDQLLAENFTDRLLRERKLQLEMAQIDSGKKRLHIAD